MKDIYYRIQNRGIYAYLCALSMISIVDIVMFYKQNLSTCMDIVNLNVILVMIIMN
jgi:hypothetical protein